MLYKYRIHICKYGHCEREDCSVLNLGPNSVGLLRLTVRKQVGESRARCYLGTALTDAHICYER